MRNVNIRAGLRDVITFEPKTAENAVSVVVQGGTVPWCLHFRAQIADRRAYVGSVKLFATKDPRLVAVVSCPGASKWEVSGEPTVLGAKDQIEVALNGHESKGGPWGVVPIAGNSVDGARAYRIISGTSGGPIVVTGTVYGWTAYSVAGGSVTCTASPAFSFTVPIAAGTSVSGDCRGCAPPVSNWTFTGTDSYFLEVLPPGGAFDG